MVQGKDDLKEIVPLLNLSPKAMEKMKAWPRKVQFELTNETSPFHIVINQGKIDLLEGPCKEPDLIVAGDAKELANVVKGVKDITHPIANGQLVVKKGKISEMTQFNRIVTLAKRG